MKKTKPELDDDLRPEYDLSKLKGGVRGKYAHRFKQGTNLVLLATDVARYFPDEKSVNTALRTLVDIAKAQVRGLDRTARRHGTTDGQQSDMNREPDIEGEVTFLPTQAGGRKSSVSSGYRGQFYYDGDDWDAIEEFPDVDKVNPGDTVRVVLRLVTPAAHKGRLKPGTIFLIREGTRTVGYGRVTKIIGLDRSAQDVQQADGSGSA